MPGMAALVEGFLLGGGLIVAIGAQNAYVLRQGLLRNHVGLLCLFCSLSDALLIVLGVAGFGAFVASSPRLLMGVTVLGVAFLVWYGIMALRRALNPSVLEAAAASRPDLRQTLAAAAAFTFLNPHVYLDTVVLVGGYSAQFTGAQRLMFGTGAALASFVWFFSLGYGARLLDVLFRKPMAWRFLDTIIAVIMWALAAKLAWPLLQTL